MLKFLNYFFFYYRYTFDIKFWQFVCLFGFLTSSSTTRLYRGWAPRQSVWQFYVLPHLRQSWETMTFCLSRSHYTDTDPNSRERAATAGIESGISSPGVVPSTDWATGPPNLDSRLNDNLIWVRGKLIALWDWGNS